MGATKQGYLAVLDKLIVTGQTDRAADADHPSDGELTDLARGFARKLGFTTLFAEVDKDTLVDLRDAYNDGREPERLDFRQVAAALGKLGVESHLEQHSGTVTLFAGPWHTPNADGVPRRVVSLGPGDGLLGDAAGWTDQLSYGPPDGDGEKVAEFARPGEVAARIAAMVTRIVGA